MNAETIRTHFETLVQNVTAIFFTTVIWFTLRNRRRQKGKAKP